MKPRDVVQIRLAVVLCALALAAGALAAGKWDFKPSAAERQALAAISVASLQAHLSFLSADPLEGRGSGSTGLDVAAEYIAAQFRRAGLNPLVTTAFQTTVRLTPATDGYRCRLAFDGRTVDVEQGQFALVTAPGARALAMREMRIVDAPVVSVLRWLISRTVMRAHGDHHRVSRRPPTRPRERRASRSGTSSWRALTALKPALVVEIRRDAARRIDYFASRQLIDPQQKGKAAPGPPSVCLWDARGGCRIRCAAAGADGRTRPSGSPPTRRTRSGTSCAPGGVGPGSWLHLRRQ
jgi:hypothetical protein